MKVFLTGGTGSLGKALLSHFDQEGEADVTVYSRDEVKQGELRGLFPDVRFMLGDVRDYDRLLMAMRGHTHVIHAGAYKQVPSAEANVDEAIATNVMGSLNVARAAVHNDVGYVVGVSTDKACQPINAYGETKALMEKLFQQADEWGETIFNCVRYGNVLASRGSVVPLFRHQLLTNKPITITDPDMTRFWMTLDQAVDLVLAAFTSAEEMEDGAILVPQCPASKLTVLAEAVCKVWGARPMTNDSIKYIGARAGEKTHESLIHLNESMHTLQPTRDVPYYQVLPATAIMPHGVVPFDYRSDVARQLTVNDLVGMLTVDGPPDA